LKVPGSRHIVFVVSRWGEAQSSETLREGGKPKKPAKSHQIKPLFLFQLLTPKFWLLNSGVQRHAGWLVKFAFVVWGGLLKKRGA
jgi:hypothetical protein